MCEIAFQRQLAPYGSRATIGTPKRWLLTAFEKGNPRRTKKSMDTLRDLWKAAGVTQPTQRGDGEGFPGPPGPTGIRRQLSFSPADALNVDVTELAVDVAGLTLEAA